MGRAGGAAGGIWSWTARFLRRLELGAIGRPALVAGGVLCLCLAAGAPGTARAWASDAGAEGKVRFDRDGDGGIGEATAIRERMRDYRERHGLEGGRGAAAMLERARWSYERWLAAEERPRVKDGAGHGWVSLGPTNAAGRCSAMAPHPSRSGTLLAGAAGGGVWRTVDSGATWYPLTDGLPDLSVGALAYAPSSPNVVYAGTGEGGYAVDFIPGIGLLRSDDGGETWQLPSGLDEVVASQFFALSVDPEDPDRILAATNEGLLASDDGGVSWETRLADRFLIGANEVVRSSQDPDLVFAALWCATTCPTGLARIMRSTDGGVSWEPAGDGLPPTRFNNADLNRTSLAVAPSDDRLLYAGLSISGEASIESRIYRSTDGGQSWSDTGYQGDYLGLQGWFDNAMTIHPTDPRIVIAAGIWYEVSHDGGHTWTSRNAYADGGDGMGTASVPHVDGQDLQWQGQTLWLACDGGVWRSEDAGLSWEARTAGLVTRQYYGIALDPIRRDRMLGGTQDNGSDLRLGPGTDSWVGVIGSDGFACAINPFLPDLVYGTIYRTAIYRSTGGGLGGWQDISPDAGSDAAPFITPLVMRPDAPWVLLTGTSRVWRSIDAGDSWQALPTLVSNGEWSTGVVRALAVTPADPRRVLVSKGRVLYASHDDGQTWTLNLAEAQVNRLELSPFDASLALACMARTGSGSGQMLRSTDGGLSWVPAGAGLPPFAVQVARWDPTDKDTVYAGTDVGLYRSTDAGLTWAAYGDGLPSVSVYDVQVLPDGSRLVVATHGRGVWELALPEPPANTPPTVSILGGGDAGILVVGEVLRLEAVAEDADGDPLTVTWLAGGPWEAVAGGRGSGVVHAVLEHRLGVQGRHQVVAHAQDSHGASGFASAWVEVVEPADSCLTPRALPGDGPFPVVVVTDNLQAATQLSDPLVPCVDHSYDERAGRWGSLWFELTPVVTGTYSVATCGSDRDPVVSIWTGPACGPLLEHGCNDDDQNEHCWGWATSSYLETTLEAGTTYRIMVGAWGGEWRGRVRLTVDCATCAERVPDHELVVPAVAFEPGESGTSWVSDVSLMNPGPVPVQADLELLRPVASPLPAAGAQVEVPAGSAVRLDDVVATVLGTSGPGALRILGSDVLMVTSRTYNAAPEGTFGQGAPALEPAGPGEAAGLVPPGGSASLIGLAGSVDRRTNLGLVGIGAGQATVVIDLIDETGQMLARRQEEVVAGRWRQLNRVFTARGLGPVEAGVAVVRNVSDQVAVAVYASVIDEATGDPVYIVPAEPGLPGAPLWIPAVVHADGVGTSRWRTDLVLSNDGQEEATLELRLHSPDLPDPAGGGGGMLSMRLSIPAGTTRVLADLVGETFGVEGAGAVEIEVEQGRILASSRTFSQAEAGTYGQLIPAVPESRAVATGWAAALLQLAEDGSFRTNIGLVNVGDQRMTVLLESFDAAGATLDLETFTLDTGAWYQHSQALDHRTSFALVRSTTIGARLLAYASVIDNRSHDPVYVAARPFRLHPLVELELPGGGGVKPSARAADRP